MSLALNNRTMKGLSALTIKRQSDGMVFSFPKAQSLVLNTGVEIKEIMISNQLGETSRADTFATSQLAELVITYGTVNPELFAFQAGYMLEQGNLNSSIPYNIQVPDSLTIPAAQSGLLGFGLTGSEEITASIIENKRSVAISPSLITLGANGELTFDASLSGKVVTLLIENTGSVISGSYISNILVGQVQIDATLVDSQNKVVALHIPNASINVGGTSLDTAADTFDLRFFPASLGCKPYQIIDTDLVISC